MYKNQTGGYIYSPSDLTLFMRSPFADWMARKALDDPEFVKTIVKEKDPMQDLLAQKGNLHEIQFLNVLKQQHGANQVIEINSQDKTNAAEQTLKAMQAGYKVIFQAYLQRDNFAGFADFIVKREGTSKLGDYYYEAWDTKFSKTTQSYFVVQLCCYSWMLEAIQGRLAEEIVIVLGNQKQDRLRIAAYYSYFLNLKQQFLSAQQAFDGKPANMPDPAFCRDFGVWGAYAKQRMATSDSLALVANIRKSQIKKLQSAAINTLSELAQSSTAASTGITQEVFDKLKAQAAMQLQSKGQSKPAYQVLNTTDGKGLSSLPPQSDKDIFFDIEGYPLLDGGLEYLWGVSYYDQQVPKGKHYAFKDWWAHDQEQEKLAMEGFIDWVYARWQNHKTMHVYHYANYEITAIRKLSNRYQTRLEEIAELLKNGVFIDLYKIVKSGLLIGEPKYSIKNVEHIYRQSRDTDVTSGGDSVVVYERWLETDGLNLWTPKGYETWRQNPYTFDWAKWPILKGIRDYNIDDCESTLELVEWLRTQQQTHNIGYSPLVLAAKTDEEQTEKQVNNAAEHQALLNRQQALINQFEANSQLQQDAHAKLLISLLHFHDRERKPKAWAYYDRLEKSESELIDDNSVVHSITVTDAKPANGTIACTGQYERSQPIRIDKIKTGSLWGYDLKVSDIHFADMDEKFGKVTFTINHNSFDARQASPLTLFGDEAYINTKTLENRLCDITEQYFKNRQLSGALNTLFNQASPRFKNNTQHLPITRQRYADNPAYLDAIIKSVQAMDQSCLCIQGPPGAGKTYTASKVIEALIKQNKRVGIMSNSHAAINNLLDKLVKELPEHRFAKVGGFGNNQENFRQLYPVNEYPNFVYRTSMNFTNRQPYPMFDVTGATAFSFANDLSYAESLDYLFVDEASQVNLANLVAASGAAKNIVLMGDQMQLEQPIQGSHPGQSGLSALEFMLKNHAVIPEDTGIFLERTYRMHPAICQPLSDVMYEGKLQADAANKNQAITIDQPKRITQENGILSVTVQHECNSQSSEEEVIVVQQLIDELKTGSFTNKDGHSRRITDKDILVVAPYNMQVNLLKEKLKGELKIGTIDKFQGQEAPVVIISMAVSDVEDSPRGLDFVFDINRLNVAISRAKALAIVVANQGLEQCMVNGLGQMERMGFFMACK
jgi:predicted RecB family nuclease